MEAQHLYWVITKVAGTLRPEVRGCGTFLRLPNTRTERFACEY
jgi:hypothetical protein